MVRRDDTCDSEICILIIYTYDLALLSLWLWSPWRNTINPYVTLLWHWYFGTRNRYSRQVLLVRYWISNITCLTLVVRTILFNQTNFLGWWYVNVCVFYDIQELDVLDDLSYYSCVYGTPLFVHTKISCQQGCKACHQPISISH